MRYDRAMKSADKYISEQQYDKAVEQLTMAINTDDRNAYAWELKIETQKNISGLDAMQTSRDFFGRRMNYYYNLDDNRINSIVDWYMVVCVNYEVSPDDFINLIVAGNWSNVSIPSASPVLTAEHTPAPASSEIPVAKRYVSPTVPPGYGKPGGLEGYWYDYQADMEIHSSVMYFTNDGLFYRKTWRQLDAGTYYINGSSVYVQYDSYYNYAGTSYYSYSDTGSTTYKFNGNEIVGFKYLHSDSINDVMLNSTIKDYADECATSASISRLDMSDSLKEKIINGIRSLYKEESYKVYKDIAANYTDISGDDIPELLIFGITDDNQIGSIEMYKIEHGIIFRILTTECSGYNGTPNYPVMLYGDYCMCYDSPSANDGYKKSVYRYCDATHSWDEIYNTQILFNEAGDKIKGYIVNNELTSKTQYDQATIFIENGRLTLSDFR